MANQVYLLGGYQTDFARHWARESLEIAHMMTEAVTQAMSSTGVDPEDIDSFHVGNFVAELFAGQGLLNGLLAETVPALAGLPSCRHEAACASGSMAVLAAMTEIEAGRSDLVCVLGVEQMKNVHGDLAAQYLGAAAWNGHEAHGAKYCWPHMFDQVSQEYEKRYGLDYRHIARIAEINYANGRRNPHAQTRAWQFQESSFTQDDESNPVIAGWVRRNDCGQVTDGAACVMLASAKYAEAYAKQHNIAMDSIPRIQGWGTKTAPISYVKKVTDSQDQPWVFPHVRATINDAFQRAGVKDVFQLDAIETHDCFAITEYMAIDHFGMTEPGKSWQAIEDGVVEFKGRLPVNPSGGLIGCGHPVGATGVRMLLDAYKQVAGKAGDYQVENASQVATLNIGGSTTSTACFVVGT